MLSRKHHSGFTLAELLIALAILGVIATFTIPKVITAQTNSANNAKFKEFLGTLSTALVQYKNDYGITASVSKDYDLFQYMNYVKYDTSSQIDERPGVTGPVTCSSGAPCIRLHNGAVVESSGQAWYNTNALDAVYYHFDPDGVYTGSNDSVVIAVYADATVRTYGTFKTSTELPGGTLRSANPAADPTWFQF